MIELYTCVAYGFLSCIRVYHLPIRPSGLALMISRRPWTCGTALAADGVVAAAAAAVFACVLEGDEADDDEDTGGGCAVEKVIDCAFAGGFEFEVGALSSATLLSTHELSDLCLRGCRTRRSGDGTLGEIAYADARLETRPVRLISTSWGKERVKHEEKKNLELKRKKLG